MKILWNSIAVAVLLALVAFSASGTVVTQKARSTPEVDIYQIAFGNSAVDTIKWVRPAGVSGISIGYSFTDTVDAAATSAVYRIVNGKAVTAIAADTLANFEAIAGTDGTQVVALDNVTLAPLASEYWFHLPFHSSGNGTGTSNVGWVYIFKQYAK